MPLLSPIRTVNTLQLLHMIKHYLLSLCLLPLLCSACIYNHDDPNPQPSSEQQVQWMEQKSLPPFMVQTNEGRSLSPEKMKGSVAVIVFFNTACGDCQKYLPTIEALHRELQSGQFTPPTSVTLLPISRAQEGKVVADYWQQVAFTMPFAAVSDRSVYQLFAQSGIPRVYIATPAGIAFRSFSDKAPASLEQLKQSIIEAAQQTKP